MSSFRSDIQCMDHGCHWTSSTRAQRNFYIGAREQRRKCREKLPSAQRGVLVLVAVIRRFLDEVPRIAG